MPKNLTPSPSPYQGEGDKRHLDYVCILQSFDTAYLILLKYKFAGRDACPTIFLADFIYLI